MTAIRVFGLIGGILCLQSPMHAQERLLDSYIEYSITETGDTILDWVYRFTYDSLGRETSQMTFVNPLDEPISDTTTLVKMLYITYRYHGNSVLSATTMFSLNGYAHPTDYEIKEYLDDGKLRSTRKTEVDVHGDTLEAFAVEYDKKHQQIKAGLGIKKAYGVPRVHYVAAISRFTIQRIKFRFDRNGFSAEKSVETKKGTRGAQIIYKKTYPGSWIEKERYSHVKRKRRAVRMFESHSNHLRRKQILLYNKYGDETRHAIYLWNFDLKKWELHGHRSTTYLYDSDGNKIQETTKLRDRTRHIKYFYK